MSLSIRSRWPQIVGQAWADPEFRARLVKDPHGTLASLGFTLPPGEEIHLLEDAPGKTHLVLPLSPGLAPLEASSEKYKQSSPLCTPADPRLCTPAEPPLCTAADPRLCTPAEPPLCTFDEAKLCTPAEPPLCTAAEPRLCTPAEPPLCTFDEARFCTHSATPGQSAPPFGD